LNANKVSFVASGSLALFNDHSYVLQHDRQLVAHRMVGDGEADQKIDIAIWSRVTSRLRSEKFEPNHMVTPANIG
jgi:uncharacterized protein